MVTSSSQTFEKYEVETHVRAPIFHSDSFITEKRPVHSSSPVVRAHDQSRLEGKCTVTQMASATTRLIPSTADPVIAVN